MVASIHSTSIPDSFRYAVGLVWCSVFRSAALAHAFSSSYGGAGAGLGLPKAHQQVCEMTGPESAASLSRDDVLITDLMPSIFAYQGSYRVACWKRLPTCVE
jgi:hypothetical protein